MYYMSAMIAAIILGFIGLLCFRYFEKRLDIARILKLAVAHIYVRILKKRTPPAFRFDYFVRDIAKRGIISLPESWLKENPRPLNSDINASDTLGFYGVNKDGCVLVARITRRHNRIAETWVYLRLPSGEEYQLPSHPDTKIYNTKEGSFSAAGLSFEILEPLRRWRVIFNGYLRRGVQSDWNNNEDDTVLVRFNFLWKPLYNYVAFPNDFRSNFLAEILAKQDWTKGFVSPYTLFSEDCIEQLGQLHGTLFIDNENERQLLLRGLKERRHGTLKWNAIRNKISVKGTLNNGTSFHIFSEKRDGKLNEFLYGYVLPPCNMSLHHVEKFTTTTQQLLSFKKCPEKLSILFRAGKNNYCLELVQNDGGFTVREGYNWDTGVDIKSYNVTMNGKPGKGIIELACPYEGFSSMIMRSSLPYLKEPAITSCQSFVVHFNDVESRSSSIVGGKGASLANMSSITDKIEGFAVPDGVCLTKHAFEHHLKKNPAIKTAILQMQNVAWQKTEGSLSDECESLEKLILDTVITEEVKNELRLKLLSTFGDDFVNLKFAVRSSAVGEDGDELSAAGQNETFLGVKGFNEILTSVIKCWASQFSFRSVEYKRQNGQLLNAGMGVVIQKMVPAEVAGVLFTRDPLTGSMGTMIISSNFGLGESVVSATADPDAITLKRSWNDKLTIEKKEIGTKKVMISMSDDSGTVEQKVDGSKASECTLSDEQIIRLGKVAIFLEKSFGGARDIEWAFCQNDIFLLQSRPVTTENVMTDFEILHEFDTTMKTDEERSSTANVGEVMPGCMSPLSSTTTMRAMGIHIQRAFTWKMQFHRFDPTVVDGMFNYLGHNFFDQIQQKTWALERPKKTMTKAIEIGLYGRVLDDDDTLELAMERFSNPPMKAKFILMQYSLRGMIAGSRIIKRLKQEIKDFHVPTDGVSTISEAYERIAQAYFDVQEPMESHIAVTFASTIWNLLILNLLSQGSDDYTMEQYTDFALLIGAGNGAESGDVPYSLKKLAQQIAKDVSQDKFTSWSPEDAYQWLCNGSNESSKKFVQFIERHGHRGIKEFDIKTISWGMKPVEVVKILQNMLSARFIKTEDEEENKSVNILDSIKTPLTPFKRKLLSVVLKCSCNAVCYREQAKSCLIKCYDNMRLAFRRLADMMVNEGFLPDPELLFFLTFEEIGILIKTRSANIIRRAKHRSRMYPIMDKMQFPEMMVGLPKPFEENDETAYNTTDSITGFPVSHGIVQGPAKVVPSFLEVNTIKPGDILITYSTDIGWSPYFPMLAGVVTEIGGLISHGAVVAREFGLPCIVGAQNATKMFKSGDTVLLDATKGILSKVI